MQMSFFTDSWRHRGQQCGEQGGGPRGGEDEARGGEAFIIILYLYIFFKGEAVRAGAEGEIQAPGGGEGTGGTWTDKIIKRIDYYHSIIGNTNT